MKLEIFDKETDENVVRLKLVPSNLEYDAITIAVVDENGDKIGNVMDFNPDGTYYRRVCVGTGWENLDIGNKLKEE